MSLKYSQGDHQLIPGIWQEESKIRIAVGEIGNLLLCFEGSVNVHIAQEHLTELLPMLQYYSVNGKLPTSPQDSNTEFIYCGHCKSWPICYWRTTNINDEYRCKNCGRIFWIDGIGELAEIGYSKDGNIDK